MTTTQTQTETYLDAESLQELLSQEPLTLVDVREPVEFAESHLVGAINVPLSGLNPAQLPQAPDQKIILYCRAGQRSHQAWQRLSYLGLPLYQLKGGITAWQAAGYPVNQNPHAPISLFRQVQIVAGALVVLGTVLGAVVSPWFLLLSGFVGTGLVLAGVTNTCALGLLLAKLPYNQRTSQAWGK